MDSLKDASQDYRNPLTTRYSSPSMVTNFSEFRRAEIWRELWVILAEEEKKLGIPVRPKQIQAMKKAIRKIDFDRIRQIEKELKHDVMSHVKAFGEVAKEAEPIIHLGATSCYVTDNSDVIILKDASEIILQKMYLVLESLSAYIEKWGDLVVTGFTHFQPAQPVTLGKRMSLWAQDLMWDVEELEFRLERLQPLGCKGATGTQASFMVLFEGDFKKVKALDAAVCERMGFRTGAVPVSGQTLSRKVDAWFCEALSNLATSFSKMSYDLRLMQHLGELREPFGKKQIGSSAMAYKRNPILAERMTSLTRFLINNSLNLKWTHATQWLERSLDDSAIRRISVAESFMAADAVCELANRILSGLEVDKERITARLEEHSSLFETEEAMMRGTLAGGSRQDLHEKIRQSAVRGELKEKGHSQRGVFSGAATAQAKEFNKKNLQSFLKKRAHLRKSSKKLVGADPI